MNAEIEKQINKIYQSIQDMTFRSGELVGMILHYSEDLIDEDLDDCFEEMQKIEDYCFECIKSMIGSRNAVRTTIQSKRKT